MKQSPSRQTLILCGIVILLLLILSLVIVILLEDMNDDDNDCDIKTESDSQTSSQEPQVQLNVGKVVGRLVESPQGDYVEEYLGIPFAKPPIGDLRFADPVPLSEFSGGSFEAFEYGNSCWGYIDLAFGDFRGSDMWNPKTPLDEDCLNLNVWVPKPKREKRAVLVWIFGGGFYSGSSSLWVYDGKALAAHADVIVVSMNYRLNSLGFLTTGDDRIKGNFGLLDQQLALKWVRDNIEAFGGDPSLVTLYGESAGAASVVYHMLSPGSADLFKRSILASGSPDSHWSFMSTADGARKSQKFFDAVGCNNDATVLDCLRALPLDTIINNEWVEAAEFLAFPWIPTVDGTFITDTPNNIIMNGGYHEKDVILGTNKDEGTFWILYSVAGLSKDNTSELSYDQHLAAIETVDWQLTEAQKVEVRQLYRPADTNNGGDNRDAIDDVVGDRSFICPTISLADQFSSTGIKNYQYLLTHRASNEVWPEWMGVIHGADIQWAFGMPLNTSRGYSQEEKAFTRTIMSYWGNFIKYGSPNGEGLPLWSQNKEKKPSFMEFKGPNDFQMHTNENLRQTYCDVWDDIDNRPYP